MPLMKAVKILVHALILNTPLLAEGLSMKVWVGTGVNFIAKTTKKISVPPRAVATNFIHSTYS